MTYLVRINLDIKEEKKAEETLRFKVASDVIKSLSKNNNKVVILSHMDRPTSFKKAFSLKRFTGLLSKATGRKIVFIPKIEGAKEIINNGPNGTVFLLENLRFWPGERKNSTRFAKKLADLGDVYINNDFATSHHKAASLVAITRYLPSREGEVVKNEVKVLTKALKNPKKPFVLVVGGAKIRDKTSTIRNLLPKVDAVLLGGGVGSTFLKASGVNIKRSLYEPELVKKIKRLAGHKKIRLPKDHIEEKNKFLDIGPETRKEYAKIIGSAKTIVWGGPLGKIEERKFAGGNNAIAKAVLRNKRAHIVIGGAQTVYSLPIEVKKQHKGNVFFSTAGGAMLYFLAGKKLPALAAIKKSERRNKKNKR